jgi:hypothetical protein
VAPIGENCDVNMPLAAVTGSTGCELTTQLSQMLHQKLSEYRALKVMSRPMSRRCPAALGQLPPKVDYGMVSGTAP